MAAMTSQETLPQAAFRAACRQWARRSSRTTSNWGNHRGIAPIHRGPSSGRTLVQVRSAAAGSLPRVVDGSLLAIGKPTTTVLDVLQTVQQTGRLTSSAQGCRRVVYAIGVRPPFVET